MTSVEQLVRYHAESQDHTMPIPSVTCRVPEVVIHLVRRRDYAPSRQSVLCSPELVTKT
jgi:hypothetical protein